MEWFMGIWPWMGAGAAIVLLIILFATDWLRSDISISRWRDPTWFAWLAAVAYMIHNVEEYGIDFTGTTLAFPNMMLGMLGEMPTWTFFLCVNLSLVWVMGPLAAALSRKYPPLAFAMVGIEAVNCLTHLPGAVMLGSISGGCITAALVFLPLVIWAFAGVAGYPKTGLKRSTLWIFIGFGVLYHVGLFLNMPLYIAGIFDGNAMGAEMLVVGCVVVALWLWKAGRVNVKKIKRIRARLGMRGLSECDFIH